jgi:hypothetical protein
VPEARGHRPLPPPLITLEHRRRRHGSRFDPSGGGSTIASSLREGNGDIAGRHPFFAARESSLSCCISTCD